MPPRAKPPPTIAASEATSRIALPAPAPSRPSTIPADAMIPSLQSTTCSRTRAGSNRAHTVVMSPPGHAGQQPGCDGVGQLAVIALGLIGVGVRERTHGLVERPALADVGGDRDGIAGARVRAGEHLAAGAGELPEPRGDELAVGDDLHVPELAHVVVVAAACGPTDEDVRGALHQPLALDDPAAVVGVATRPAARLGDRGTRLLDLPGQRISPGAAFPQGPRHPPPAAADPHGPAGG